MKTNGKKNIDKNENPNIFDLSDKRTNQKRIIFKSKNIPLRREFPCEKAVPSNDELRNEKNDGNKNFLEHGEK